MIKQRLRDVIFRYSWDTSCRNVDVASIINPLLAPESSVLDVGCGENGIASFLKSGKVTGVDIDNPQMGSRRRDYVRGSILRLPFSECSFSYGVSVDVLEHLPEPLRWLGLQELIRVAADGIVISFPSGINARQADETFRRELIDFKRPLPDWLEEHLANPFPDGESVIRQIEAAAMATGRRVRTVTYYSERIEIARFLRWSAARSKYLYVLINLAAGLLAPLMPRVKKNKSYRTMIHVEFL